MIALLLVAAASLLMLGQRSPAVHRDRTGLFTTLPILWGEDSNLAAALRPGQEAHWARAIIADGGEIVPLDALAAPGSAGPLDALTYLVIAQSRPLSPDENVALDAWVRAGGQVLVLADPMLTEESAYPIGDRRRPQSVALLSPILGRWGLDMSFDERQALGDRPVEVLGAAVPVNLPGHLTLRKGADCRLVGDGVAAICRIDKGRALVLADAALIERDDPGGARRRALSHLLANALAAR